NSLEDADVALLVVDINDDWKACDEIFASLHLKVPAIVIVNKIDTANTQKMNEAVLFFKNKTYCKKVLAVSAFNVGDRLEILNAILDFLPSGEKFYDENEISDLSTRFFVGELIREKIYEL